MDNDYKRFCLKCNWTDPDLGCGVDPNERVFQCPMYMHYHPDEVKEWEEGYKEWLLAMQGRKKDG